MVCRDENASNFQNKCQQKIHRTFKTQQNSNELFYERQKPTGKRKTKNFKIRSIKTTKKKTRKKMCVDLIRIKN